MTDISQALLQSAKSYAFTKGRYHGSGPSAEKLANRINKGQTILPQNVGKMVADVVFQTPMQKHKEKKFDNVAKSVKRKKPTQVYSKEINATHRPDYVFEEVHQRQPRQRHFEDEDSNGNRNANCGEKNPQNNVGN